MSAIACSLACAVLTQPLMAGSRSLSRRQIYLFDQIMSTRTCSQPKEKNFYCDSIATEETFQTIFFFQSLETWKFQVISRSSSFKPDIYWQVLLLRRLFRDEIIYFVPNWNFDGKSIFGPRQTWAIKIGRWLMPFHWTRKQQCAIDLFIQCTLRVLRSPRNTSKSQLH